MLLPHNDVEVTADYDAEEYPRYKINKHKNKNMSDYNLEIQSSQINPPIHWASRQKCLEALAFSTLRISQDNFPTISVLVLRILDAEIPLKVSKIGVLRLRGAKRKGFKAF